MHTGSPKQQKLGVPIQTCGVVVVLNGGVGMQDRLLHVKQRIAEEKVTFSKNFKSMDACRIDRNAHTIPIDSQHSIEVNMRSTRLIDSRDGSVQSNTGTDQVPLGVPLPKPPALPNLTRVNQHDSGSSYFGSTGQLGNDELMTDEESTTDKSTVCDSKIYEMRDHTKQRQCFPCMTHYKTMNPDEVIFLEAACALSRVGSDIGHVSDTKFEQPQLPPIDRQCSMRAHSSPAEPGIGTSKNVSMRTIKSDKTITTPSKKRQPLGPPPYTLRKIRKTALP